MNKMVVFLLEMFSSIYHYYKKNQSLYNKPFHTRHTLNDRLHLNQQILYRLDVCVLICEQQASMPITMMRRSSTMELELISLDKVHVDGEIISSILQETSCFIASINSSAAGPGLDSDFGASAGWFESTQINLNMVWSFGGLRVLFKHIFKGIYTDQPQH